MQARSRLDRETAGFNLKIIKNKEVNGEKTLSRRAVTLSDTLKVGNKILCRLLENNMALVSPFSLAVLTPGGNGAQAQH